MNTKSKPEQKIQLFELRIEIKNMHNFVEDNKDILIHNRLPQYQKCD